MGDNKTFIVRLTFEGDFGIAESKQQEVLTELKALVKDDTEFNSTREPKNDNMFYIYISMSSKGSILDCAPLVRLLEPFIIKLKIRKMETTSSFGKIDSAFSNEPHFEVLSI